MENKNFNLLTIEGLKALELIHEWVLTRPSTEHFDGVYGYSDEDGTAIIIEVKGLKYLVKDAQTITDIYTGDEEVFY